MPVGGPAATERALGLVAGREIDDFDIVEDRVDAGGVATAERPFVTEARVGRATLGRTSECGCIPEASVLIVCIHTDGSPRFSALPVMRQIGSGV